MAKYEFGELELLQLEKQNSGTAKTLNEELEKKGFLAIKNLCNPKDLYFNPYDLPKKYGKMAYWGSRENEYNYEEEEDQVDGSVARYWYPGYRELHSKIRMRIEKEIGKKLYNTYYYDRFYSEGQELSRHIDRNSCEISVSVHISSNLEKPWPLWFKTPDKYADEEKSSVLEYGKEIPIVLNPGDGVIYKGCEIPHWRNIFPINKENKFISFFSKKPRNCDLYYHQIFFHYVLQDGQRAHCAWDRQV